MNDSRLRNKIEETRTIAARRGLDLGSAPLLVTFDMPIKGAGLAIREINELARAPGAAVAVTSSDPLPAVRRRASAAPHLHVLAERGLMGGLSGGATLHLYPNSSEEMRAFAVALFAGVAPEGVRFSLGGHLSSGRQEVTFEEAGPTFTGRELLHAIRHRGGAATVAGDGAESVVVDDVPAELEAARAALAEELCGRAMRVLRMPSGRFRISPDNTPREPGRDKIRVLAQQIAVSSDRVLEASGGNTFGYPTEAVARGDYGLESGARVLAAELFERPDTALTHLGLEPFLGEGTLCFVYEGSETVWEAADKDVGYVPVRDLAEYCRILHAIRQGGEP